jgi:hypothetical protein
MLPINLALFCEEKPVSGSEDGATNMALPRSYSFRSIETDFGHGDIFADVSVTETQ